VPLLLYAYINTVYRKRKPDIFSHYQTYMCVCRSYVRGEQRTADIRTKSLGPSVRALLTQRREATIILLLQSRELVGTLEVSDVASLKSYYKGVSCTTRKLSHRLLVSLLSLILVRCGTTQTRTRRQNPLCTLYPILPAQYQSIIIV
jgi:hypothetical protein